MQKRNVKIELPRPVGQETELFVQSTAKNATACSAHIHNAVELLYVKEGSYSVKSDDASYEIASGDLILFCSGTLHYVVAGEEEKNSYYVIKIPPALFIDFVKRNTGAEYAMRFAINRKGMKCLWKKEELANSETERVLTSLVGELEQERYASELAIKLKIMELLVCILRDGEKHEMPTSNQISRRIYLVMSHVQENYAADFDEKALAKSYGMSYSYFSRSFKQVTGMTFKNYLNRTRIGKAEQLLALNGCSVSEAATASGYNNISYFISVYRSVMGKTPYKALKERNG